MPDILITEDICGQQAIRLLAQRGIVDLLKVPIAMGKIHRKVVTQAV